MAKWSVQKIVTDHLSTLVDARRADKHLRRWDLIAFYVLPVIIGMTIVVPAFNFSWLIDIPGYRQVSKFRVGGLEGILSGVSIYTALFFGLLVQIFQLKTRFLDAGESGARVVELNDQLEANVSYAILIGISTTALLLFTVATTPKDLPAGRVSSAVIVVLMLHLILTLFMVLKRARAVYREL